MKKILVLLFVLCVTNIAAFATRYYPASVNAPVGTSTYCANTMNAAFTATVTMCPSSNGSILVSNTITADWYFNGAIVYSNTYVRSNTTAFAITLPANTFTFGTAGVFSGTSGLYVELSNSATFASCPVPADGPATTITVNSPAAITGTNSLCILATTSLSDATSGGTWGSSTTSVATINSSGVVSGVAAGTSTITYTASGCYATTVVTVNPSPSSFTISPSAPAICPTGPAQLLTAGASTYAGNKTFGTQANQNTSTSYPAVFSQYWGSQRTQFLVRASELTAMGFAAGGSLTAINFQVVSLGSTYTDNSFQIRIAPTALNALSAFVTTGLVTARSASNYTPVVGDNVLTFTTPYTWDGTSNLVFDVTFGNNVAGTTTTSAIQYYTSTSFNSFLVYYADNVTAAAAASSTTISLGPNTNRPDFILYGTLTAPVTWTNTSGLYTNAGATTAYTGTATNTVYALPASTSTYTATATGAGGCSKTTTVPVTINPTPPAIDGTLSACVGSTSQLTNTSGGGVWTSSAPGVASISASGLVTAGATAGTATISYAVGGGCPITAVFAVNGSPGAITGNSGPFCSGTTLTLANAGGVGTWTSSNTAAATVSASTGIVTGVAGGTSVISYSNGCGTPASTIVSINQTPSITGVSGFCLGGTTTLSGFSAGGTWSSSATSIGTVGAANGVVGGIAVGTATISYTLGNGCTVATKVVTVNNVPSSFTISPSSASICSSGPAQSLVAGASSISTTAVSGSQQNVNTSTSYPAVFNQYWGGQRTQFLVRASELSAMGFGTGSSLTAINFKVVSLASTYSDNNFQIRIAPTASTTLSGFVTTGLVTARSTSNYTPVVGDNVLTFTTPYTWDGTSNLVFDVTFSNNVTGTTTTSAIQYNSNTSFNSTVVYYADGTTAAAMASATSISIGPGTGRPDFNLTGTTPIVPTWSPSTGLYTNAGATISYTGSAVSTVYALPAATSTYTATVNNNGCATTATATVTIADPDVSNFSIVATSPCQGAASTATVNSTSLVNGTYTVTYNLTGANSATASTASLTLSGGTGTFSIPSGSLGTVGSTTITVTSVKNASNCSSSLSSGNTASFSVNGLPTTVTVSGGGVACGSATLTASNGGSGTIYYQGSTSNGTSTALGGTPQVVSSGGTYYFRAQSVAGCWGTQGSAAVTVNPTPDVSNLSIVTSSPCLGAASTATVTSTSLGAGTYTITYDLTGSNSSIGNTVTVAIAANTGTFTIPSGQLSAAGATGLAITSVKNSFNCTSATGATTGFTVNALPTTVTVTGGGVVCGSATLVASNGGSGTIYYQGATSNGTSTGLGGTPQVVSTGGTYYFRAQSAAGCWGTQGSSAVTVNPMPDVTNFAIASSSPCLGAAATATVTSTSLVSGVYTVTYDISGVNSSTGNTVSVTMSSGAGTFVIPAGLLTTDGASNVTVTSIQNSFSCSSSPSAGNSASFTVVTLPTVADITPSVTSLCPGGDVTFTAGAVTGMGSVVSYTWSGPNGYTAATASNSVLFTPTTTASSGDYSVTVTYSTSGCISAPVATSPSVTVNALPTVASISPSSLAACTGQPFTLTAGATTGAGSLISYNWSGPNGYSSTTAVDNAVFTPTTTAAAGAYSLSVTYPDPGCTSAIVTSSPVAFSDGPTIDGITNNSPVCVGATINLTAVNPLNATDFSWSGPVSVTSGATTASASVAPATLAASGIYSLTVSNSVTTCASVYTTSVTVNNVPSVAGISNNGPVCASNTLTLSSGSASNVTDYAWAGPVAITNATSASATVPSATTTASGVYTLTVNNGIGVGCSAVYTMSATVNASSPVYTMTGGGAYCAGGAGSLVGLANSQSGIQYQLYRGSSAVGTPVTGSGSSISFGYQTAAGTYTVSATNTATSCVADMSGTAIVTVSPYPTIYPVIGGGSYCAGGTGVLVGLAYSDAGAGYQLYNGVTPIGSLTIGTGAPLSFGIQTLTGTYTAVANPGSACAAVMSGSATVSINPLPTAYTVTGGGAYCTSGSGVPVGLTFGQSGVQYTLYNGSSASTIASGANAVLSFGNQTAPGVYSVSAVNMTTGCSSDMTGTVTVSVNATPAVFSVTGGGNFCSGGSGVAVGVSGSSSTSSYQLYNGSTAVGAAIAGTGSAISFGSQTVAGTYSVLATGSNGCTAPMTGTAVVGVNTQPTAYAITGGGTYCSGGAGVPVGLAFGNSGVQYTLYNGSSSVSVVVGSNAAINFGNQTSAGTYSVSAIDVVTGCTRGMTGTVAVSVNALPAVNNVTGGGSYCAGGAGVAINISGSTTGVTYQLYNGSTSIGSGMSGTGSGFSFGNQTSAGTYSVLATAANGCTAAMTGTPSVVVNPNPSAFSVTGGATYCAGGAGGVIGLGGSASGVNYQLYNGSTPLNILPGTGSAISFGTFTAVGTYSVQATNATTGCVAPMSGTAVISISSAPATFSVTGGGSMCTDGAGVAIGLGGSAGGVSYQLYSGGSVVATVPGTGSAISFGSFTTAGTYTVLATTTSTGCTAPMTGSATITVNALPTAFAVTGGGAYCAGGTGVAVGLSGSSSGISYTLYNGATPVGSAAGTGSPISFGVQTLTGSYTVFAQNTITGCTNTMTGSATISTNPLPAAFAVTGGGGYCAGGTGVPVGLSSSTSGVNYSLYSGPSLISVVAGTGSAISFGSITTAGTYTVQASNGSSGCNANMTGSATVSINANPGTFAVTGGGSYCSGGAGLPIGLGGSATGINYQLYTGATTVGSPVAGTNSAITFGNQTGAGVYTVLATNATTGCTTTMTGSATISINPTPAAFAVIGGGSYCSGGTGVTVGLGNSATGVNYQLYNGASTAGSSVSGTGGAITFGTFTTAGTYTVLATGTVGSCTAAMSGSAIISINALPTAYAVSGTATICAGSGSTITLANSQTGINYQLYLGSTPVGSLVAGTTGSSISFGSQSVAGTYTVLATNASTGCIAGMTGSAVITVNAAPTVYTVSGGGSYCSGGTGLTVVLSNSNTGITYNLYNGSTSVTSMSGTGSSLSFPAQTAAGTYTVQAVNGTTTCTANMAGSATISINALPTAFTVTGTGSYCAGGSGVDLGLSGSTSGINYQLYTSAGASGAAVPGTGTILDLGVRTAAGTYSVMAVNSATGCTNMMTGTAVITINPLPTAFNVIGGGSYCSGGTGVPIGVDGSATGVIYQLYRGSVAVSGASTAGTGGAITFGLQTAAGTYSVRATVTATGCQNDMVGTQSISINPLPVAFAITGGGAYCSGGTGSNVGLNGSTVNVSYQLYVGGSPAGTAVTGTGAAISFGPQTTAGTYSVVATDMITGCINNMVGTVNVSINNTPTVYAVIGGGSYCAGGAGMDVSLASSEAGVNYQLYRGAAAIGALMPGSGSLLDFGLETTAGNYSVVATNATTGCIANMSGSVAVSVNPLPALFTVTGGGNYCIGGAGVTVGLSNSTVGINYQLYNGSTAVGAPIAGLGGAISFGTQTATGTYTVLATNTTTGCTRGMGGNAVIATNVLPTAYTVTGGGGYCPGGSGVVVGLASSNTGITYQLYNGPVIEGAPVSGTGGSISFGLQTAVGTYSVLATNITSGCSNAMSSGVVVSINPLPADQTITGGGTYCSGGSGLLVGLASSESGISYQLYNGGSAMGGPVAGTGTTISFGVQTAAGTYSVLATNTTTGCAFALSGTGTIVVNPVPTGFAIAGGGSYCIGGTGVEVHITGSQTGISYQLFNGSTSVATMAGTGAAVSFGNQTASGTYSILATNTATTCQAAMPGTATVNIEALPTVYTVMGTGSSYCAGGTGVDILLSGSQLGVNYQLFNGSVPTGAPVAGTGSLIDFGSQTVAGAYIVVATSTGACTSNMSGSASITISPLPTQYTITGGGGYCSGSAGAIVGLSGSQPGVNYQLFRGTTAVGLPVPGTGSAISFGAQATAGAYVVVASNPATGCQNTMFGSVSVSVNPLPALQSVTGGGNVCSGGAGVAIGLAGSATGINYQLYNGSTAVVAVPGTGSAVTFGPQTAAGVYTVLAVNSATLCSRAMTGNATIVVNAAPTAFNVTGGGSYCVGSTMGVAVGLDSSASGFTYQLYNGTSPIGGALAGTGSALNFGTQSATGTYTVRATNAATMCTAGMTGNAVVTANAAPVLHSVTGGGSYCGGGAGVHVGLDASNTGTTYTLYDGATAVGSAMAGTGSAIDFGSITASGTYTVLASNPSGCSRAMTGSATVVTVATFTPTVVISTSVGDTMCLGVLTTFNASGIGDGPGATFQWQVNGFNVGLGGSSYTYLPANGDVVAVQMNSSLACAMPTTATASMPVTVLVSQMPVATVSASPNDTVCLGSSVTLDVTPSYGGATPVFTWKNAAGATLATGTTSYTFVPSGGEDIYVEMISNYRCRLADDVHSAHTTIVVDSPTAPVVTISVTPGNTIAAGQMARFVASANHAGYAAQYQWYVNGAAIAGATTNEYSNNELSNNDTVTCVVTKISACAPAMGQSSVVMKVAGVGIAGVSLSGSDIMLVPNPNKGDFVLKGTVSGGDDQEMVAEVTDMLGQVIYRDRVAVHHGNVESHISLDNTLANGMYILTLHSATDRKVFHFMIGK